MVRIGIRLVGYGIFSYPEGMEGWSCYRIEYWGKEHYATCEGQIWLPPGTGPDVIEKLLEDAQNETKGR